MPLKANLVTGSPGCCQSDIHRSSNTIGDTKVDRKTPLPKYTSREAKGKLVTAVWDHVFLFALLFLI